MKPGAVDRNAELKVRPAAPIATDPVIEGKIRIDADPKAAAVAGKAKTATIEQFWLDFYKKHDEAPADLKDKLAALNRYNRSREVRAILYAYLKLHPEHHEPWMYEAYALSLSMTGASDTLVKSALDGAAYLAKKTRNPNHLVSVADQLVLRGFTDGVGPLLDQAADLIPHRGEPLLMSIKLARKTKDPKRMGDAIERLLSLGWPDMDEAVRRDARKEAETLASALREDARGGEADALLARLPDAEARDLFIRLTWVGDAGLDLVVDEPLGATAKVVTPRTVFGGSIVKDGYGNHPEEVYVCPRGFDGVYTLRVETTYNNPEKPALTATLEVITHEGTPNEHKASHTLTLKGDKAPDPVKITLTGGRRTKALPFLAPNPVPPPSMAGPVKRKRPAAAAKPVDLVAPKSGETRPGIR